MMGRILFSMALIVALTAQTSFAGECQSDSDCKNGDVCVLAVTPHVCKPPQAAGAPCKRDAVCISKKCDIPAGKDAGTCK
jgi:hypothetical protein